MSTSSNGPTSDVTSRRCSLIGWDQDHAPSSPGPGQQQRLHRHSSDAMAYVRGPARTSTDAAQYRVRVHALPTSSTGREPQELHEDSFFLHDVPTRRRFPWCLPTFLPVPEPTAHRVLRVHRHRRLAGRTELEHLLHLLPEPTAHRVLRVHRHRRLAGRTELKHLLHLLPHPQPPLPSLFFPALPEREVMCGTRT